MGVKGVESCERSGAESRHAQMATVDVYLESQRAVVVAAAVEWRRNRERQPAALHRLRWYPVLTCPSGNVNGWCSHFTVRLVGMHNCLCLSLCHRDMRHLLSFQHLWSTFLTFTLTLHLCRLVWFALPMPASAE